MSIFKIGTPVVFDAKECFRRKETNTFDSTMGGEYWGEMLSGTVVESDWGTHGGEEVLVVRIDTTSQRARIRRGQRVAIVKNLLKTQTVTSKEDMKKMYHYLTGETYNAKEESDAIYGHWLTLINQVFQDNIFSNICRTIEARVDDMYEAGDTYCITLYPDDTWTRYSANEIISWTREAKEQGVDVKDYITLKITNKTAQSVETIKNNFLTELRRVLVCYYLRFSNDIERKIFEKWWLNIVEKKLIDFTCQFNIEECFNNTVAVTLRSELSGTVGYPAITGDFNKGTSFDDVVFKALHTIPTDKSDVFQISRYDYDLMLRHKQNRCNSAQREIVNGIKSLTAGRTYFPTIECVLSLGELCKFANGEEVKPRDYVTRINFVNEATQSTEGYININGKHKPCVDNKTYKVLKLYT